MTAQPAIQEYAVGKTGRRHPTHTPKLRTLCRCNRCHMRRWWTPARRAARSEQLRQQYASGVRRQTGEHNRRKRWCWTREQDDALRALAGQTDCGTVARMLTEHFGYRRSENAVKHRLLKLGISRMAVRLLSSSEVGRLFGISRETVLQRFVKHGRLLGTKRRRGPHGFIWLFTRADVERLIREYPEAYAPDRIRDPGLRALAIAVARGRRLLSTTEVSERTANNTRSLAGWFARGLVPSARKVRGVLPGAGGAWVVPIGDLDQVRALPALLAERRRRRSEARRDPLTGTFLAAGEYPSPELRCTIRVISRAEALERMA